MVLEKFEDIAGFNLMGYTIQHHGGLKLIEWIPSYERFYELPQTEGYLGIDLIFDNINKIIWIWQDDKVKTKKFVKKLKNETKTSKIAEITNSLFEDLLNFDISSYEFKRAQKYREQFMNIFKYQINEYPLYASHYYLPQYEGEAEALTTGPTEEEPEEVTSNLKTCANCGWILSATATVCPKCHRSPREKFEGKKE